MTTNLLTPTPAAMVEQLTAAQTVAVVFGPDRSDDMWYAAQALAHQLMAAGKTVTIAASYTVEPTISFYQTPISVNAVMTGKQQLVIRVPLEQVVLDEVSYDTVGEALEITLVPKAGTLNPQAVAAMTTGGGPDMLVTLGVNHIEDLGALYAQQSDIFINTPRFNISNSPENDYSGTWNWVNPTAISYAELVTPLLDALTSELGSETATLLLAATMTATNGFQHPKTTPDVLGLAARLMAAGARHADIVRDFYKTKPFAHVKLWGRALARINTLSETALFTSISQSDFQKTELTEAIIPELLRDIVEQVTGYHSIFLTTETSEGITLWFAILPHVDIVRLARTFELGVPSLLALGSGVYQWGSFVIPGGTQLAVEAKLRDFVTQ